MGLKCGGIEAPTLPPHISSPASISFMTARTVDNEGNCFVSDGWMDGWLKGRKEGWNKEIYAYREKKKTV